MSQSDSNKRGEAPQSENGSDENPSKIQRLEMVQNSKASSSTNSNPGSGDEAKDDNKEMISIKNKAELLAQFIIKKVTGEKDSPSDEIDETLLRCVNSMMEKHDILFKSWMKKINITDQTAYAAFLTAANELFDGERRDITWSRIVALYAFGGQLALHCKENNLKECGLRIPTFVGKYARDVISSFVLKEGGWKKICEIFPPTDDLDRKVWKFLTVTAVGLSIATAASFLASR